MECPILPYSAVQGLNSRAGPLGSRDDAGYCNHCSPCNHCCTKQFSGPAPDTVTLSQNYSSLISSELIIFIIKRVVILYIFLSFTVIDGCRIDECSNYYSRTMDFESLTPAGNSRYCEILSTYQSCINETMKSCHSNLKFHFVQLQLKRQFDQYNCRSILEKESDKGKRKFDGGTMTCNEQGAMPMVDNRFFLIQVSTTPLHSGLEAPTITRVVVLIKSHNCTSPLTYEAASDMEHLPASFTDGTLFVPQVKPKNAIEILRQDSNSVVIYLRHAASTIQLTREGPYLSVSLTVPNILLSTYSHSDDQLCLSGCRHSVPISHSLADPHGYSRCLAIQLHVPPHFAHSRCALANTTDFFYDSCVFDLMTTGDEFLVAMSLEAQKDIRRMHPTYRYIERGRQDVLIHEEQQHPGWSDCVSVRSADSVKLQTTKLLLFLSFIRFIL